MFYYIIFLAIISTNSNVFFLKKIIWLSNRISYHIWNWCKCLIWSLSRSSPNFWIQNALYKNWGLFLFFL